MQKKREWHRSEVQKSFEAAVILRTEINSVQEAIIFEIACFSKFRIKRFFGECKFWIIIFDWKLKILLFITEFFFCMHHRIVHLKDMYKDIKNIYKSDLSF